MKSGEKFRRKETQKIKNDDEYVINWDLKQYLMLYNLAIYETEIYT